MCRGQGYDGAAVMKGFYSGLQKRIKDKVPTASYIHCCAHNLNLIISDAVKSNQKVQFFFLILFKLSSIFSVQVHQDGQLWLLMKAMQIKLKK